MDKRRTKEKIKKTQPQIERIQRNRGNIKWIHEQQQKKTPLKGTLIGFMNTEKTERRRSRKKQQEE